MIDQFFRACETHFRFLQEEYGFRSVAREKGALSGSVVYTNGTTGVEVKFDLRDSAVWVMLVRLIDGQEPPWDDRENRHGLDSLVYLRSESPGPLNVLRDPGPFGSEELDREVRADAENLSRFASDILKGDFSSFPALAEVERRRMDEWERMGTEPG